MENIFYRTLLNDRLKIEPKYLSKDYRLYIQSKLKGMLEGTCSKHGYIKKGSIEIYKVAPGFIELIGLNGSVVFEVYYYADVCNPLIGNVLKATVTNVNKFGILAESSNILEIIIAKNSVNITHDYGIDLEKVQIGHQVMVEVIGKKFELNDNKISVVGKIVSGITSTIKQKKVVKDDKVDKIDEDDVEDDVDVLVDGEEEEEKENEDDDNSLKDLNELNELNDEDEEEFQKGGNEFFDSDEDQCDDEYEFYSEEDNFDEEDEDEGGEY